MKTRNHRQADKTLRNKSDIIDNFLMIIGIYSEICSHYLPIDREVMKATTFKPGNQQRTDRKNN